ncbi:SDR family NAD(P)-dependent oxidoreductase [Prauserella flavalba]|uniref:SDR family NAD(P)-dependent oxidoreductase n=1 Tax=Prauserella flavalba TaxID=1477506 RepID=UPI000D76157D|nr:SDR family NAD(P)-dependent oxidoreductase [Prauserella flavalba]
MGRQAALRLAKEGHELILIGRDAERGLRLERETGARFVRADLSTMDGVTHVAGRVAAEVDRVDVLINNAGVMTPKRIAHPQ